MKKPFLTKTRIACFGVFLLILLPVSQVGTTKGNPYILEGFVQPDSLTKPPKVEIHSPQNNTIITSKEVTLSFNVTNPESSTATQTVLAHISYKADWLNNTTYLYDYGIQTGYYIKTYNHSYTFTDVPEGNHTVIIYAEGLGWYSTDVMFHTRGFFINQSLPLFFIVDTVKPTVSISIKNESYNNNNIPLDVFSDKDTAELSYSLDGKQNVTTTGNTTLTGLADGNHHITVYAKDHAGLTGKSETIYFTVNTLTQFFPIALAGAFIVTVIGLLMYWRIHKRKRH